MNFGPAERTRREARRERRKNEHPHARLPLEIRLLFLVIVIAVLAQVGWIASGGSLYRVDSTSMCPKSASVLWSSTDPWRPVPCCTR